MSMVSAMPITLEAAAKVSARPITLEASAKVSALPITLEVSWRNYVFAETAEAKPIAPKTRHACKAGAPKNSSTSKTSRCSKSDLIIVLRWTFLHIAAMTPFSLSSS